MLCPNCHQSRINLAQCEHCQSRAQGSENHSLELDVLESPMLENTSIMKNPIPKIASPEIDPIDEDNEQTGIKNEILEGQLALENKYVLGKEIGRGGMGFVYQALDLSLKRVVAIKILPPRYNQDQQIISRFLKEARAMAMLDHPSIVPVYSIGHAEGLHYFVMKFLEGKTISKIIQRQNKSKQPSYHFNEITSIITQICDGLAHAHSKNILHRDIKPSNLMVGEQLKTTIMDFGIVKLVEKNTEKTQQGKIFGTPEYMSPEQAMGKGEYYAASDIYSLAVVLYELICGELPFQAEGPIEMIIQHIRQPFPGFKGKGQGLYTKLEKVIAKAMAKDPMQRYQTVIEFKKAILDAQDSQPDINPAALSFNMPILTPTEASIPPAIVTAFSHMEDATEQVQHLPKFQFAQMGKAGTPSPAMLMTSHSTPNTAFINPSASAIPTPPPFAFTPTPPTMTTELAQLDQIFNVSNPTQAISLENSPIPAIANSLELNQLQQLTSPSYSPIPTRPSHPSAYQSFSPILDHRAPIHSTPPIHLTQPSISSHPSIPSFTQIPQVPINVNLSPPPKNLNSLDQQAQTNINQISRPGQYKTLPIKRANTTPDPNQKS